MGTSLRMCRVPLKRYSPADQESGLTPCIILTSCLHARQGLEGCF